MRLIDADLLEPDADYDDGEFWAVSMTQIENAPTIEPKKGTWYERYSHEDEERDGVRCSECGTHYYLDGQLMNFCPNCGADMREGEADG